MFRAYIKGEEVDISQQEAKSLIKLKQVGITLPYPLSYLTKYTNKRVYVILKDFDIYEE